ncbi:hypothetical protein FBU59_002667 [Linderina macrospora]|uniref:Uncharacterized protein n=1 Tax=Linderina macrospora TaxID=4868 RepID=A0ACC1JAI0_9FUNG|nr:hypothetical protein FBU59_002667 [Linderina macrospora]
MPSKKKKTKVVRDPSAYATVNPEKQNDHTDNTDDIASWVSLSLAQTQAEARVDKELQLKDRMAATGPVVVLSEKSEQMVIEKIRAGELELPVPDVEQLVGVKDWTRSINFVFETLVKYGFSEDDIRDAMQATKGAGDILDMLSWLCFHVPADRLPPQLLCPSLHLSLCQN